MSGYASIPIIEVEGESKCTHPYLSYSINRCAISRPNARQASSTETKSPCFISTGDI